ncbi:MAG: DUF5797 family protein [Halanaeroarchaeum sp.]
MPLSEEARERLADIVELQPTKNKELQERWGMESGSEVHRYLEGELREYYYRDEDSLIRATAEAVSLVTGEAPDEILSVHMSELEQEIVRVLPAPGEDSLSVVSVLHALEDATGERYDVGEVRRALQTLARKGVAEKVPRTVPTFRLAVEREAVERETEVEA